MAYNRASVHLLTFKRALVEGARVLSEALQWVSLVDYAVMAWGYVKVKTERTCIHKVNLLQKTDFKTDSFSRLFTDVLFSVFCHLPDIYVNRSFYNNTVYRLHTAFLHWPLSSAATKEVQGPDTT